jgi:glycosyltransferase involved in cell wall biosynthesis
LTIAGAGPERDRLAPDAPPTVSFVGELPNKQVLELIGRSEALIFPSQWPEGLGVAWIEALALGTPVIYSDAGSFTDALDEYHCGSRFRAGDPASLAEAVSDVDNLPEQAWNGLSRRARISYERHYRPEQALRRLEVIYHSVMARTPAARGDVSSASKRL